MIVVEAPNKPHIGLGPYTASVFLAGGITGCPDWQAELLEMVKDTDLLIFNPRRKEWPQGLKQDEEARRQIAWEIQMLDRVGFAAFWFPKETICPIALLELGYWIGAYGEEVMDWVTVGCHPEYSRKFDVQQQLQLRDPLAVVHEDLGQLAQSLIELDRLDRLHMGELHWPEDGSES